MAFCGKCGKKMDDGAKFCPACGASTELPSQGIPGYTPPVVPGAPGQADIRDAQDNKVMAVLAYFGPLVLIPIFAAKESRFARYHSNQGLVLLILSVAISVLYNILTSILYAVSWRLGVSISGILGLVFVIPTILAILGIIHACKGEMKPLPVIGGIKLLK